MHYFDPSRPRLANGRPALLARNGNVLGALIAPEVFPTKDEHWLLRAWLQTGFQSYSNYPLKVQSVDGFLSKWKNFPEEVFHLEFGWPWPETSFATSTVADNVQVNVSAKSLGL